MTELILVCIAIGIFLIYNITMICLFGMPSSLSNTFYYLNNKKEHSGWAFTLMMYIVCFLLAYPWCNITMTATSWSNYLIFLPFFAIGSLLFVAAAPNFRDDSLPNVVHMTCAKLAAVLSLLWICIICWKIMWIIPVWAVLCGGIAYLTKTAKSGRDWWWEMVAFGSTFTAIIIKLLV